MADNLERIERLEPSHLECRSIGHAWTIRWWGSITELPEDLIPPVVRIYRWTRVRVSVCLRCRTVRDEFFPSDTVFTDADPFQVQLRRYRYANGYLLEGIGESPRRHQFNRVAYDRWKEGSAFLSPASLPSE